MTMARFVINEATAAAYEEHWGPLPPEFMVQEKLPTYAGELGTFEGMRFRHAQPQPSGISYSLLRGGLVDEAVRQRLGAIADGYELDTAAPSSRVSLVRLAACWICLNWSAA